MISTKSQRNKRYSQGAGSKLAKLLGKLYAANNRCHYCGRTTSIHPKKKILPNGAQRPYAATVDHVFEYNDLRRHCIGGDDLVVLACYECNNKKSRLVNFEIFGKYKMLYEKEISIIELPNIELAPEQITE